MEKGFRLVKCPGSTVERCRFTLRIKVTEKDYGETRETICPKCGVTFKVTVNIPPDEQPAKEKDSSKDFFGGLKWPFK